MANAAAKRIHAENAKMLRFLDIGTLTTMTYFVACWFMFLDGFKSCLQLSSFNVLVLGSMLLELFTLLHLHKLGDSSFSEAGPDGQRVLQECGIDLSDSENFVVQLLMDFIYVSWLVHGLSILSLKVWWLYMLIPAFAIYKLVKLVRGLSGFKKSDMNASTTSFGGSGPKKRRI